MIKDPATGEWKEKSGIARFVEPWLDHVTREETFVIGKWSWASTGLKIDGQIQLLDTGEFMFRYKGKQFEVVGKWKMIFGKVTLKWTKTKKVQVFTFNVRTGWKCTDPNCDVGVKDPILTHDPFYGQPEATFLGEHIITIDSIEITIRFNDDRTISWKKPKYDWIHKGEWIFTNYKVWFKFDGKEYNMVKKDDGTYEDTSTTPVFVIKIIKTTHVIKDPVYDTPKAKVIGIWTMHNEADKNAIIITQIAIRSDGTVRTRDITNEGKWLIDVTWTWTLAADGEFTLIINSKTITLKFDTTTDMYVTTDKTIVVKFPDLVHAKPTNNDDIDPNNGRPWNMDIDGKPIHDNWPKHPVTDVYMNPIKYQLPEVEILINIETGCPYH